MARTSTAQPRKDIICAECKEVIPNADPRQKYHDATCRSNAWRRRQYRQGNVRTHEGWKGPTVTTVGPNNLEREIDTAVAWWARQLIDAVHDGTTGRQDHDTLLIRTRKSLREPVTTGDVERFTESLRAVVMEHLATSIYLSTDYEAEGLIYEACSRAGLKREQYDYRLPMVTKMWIRSGSVAVAIGRDAVPEEIFTK